jgi:excisionase family DNA binding protein
LDVVGSRYAAVITVPEAAKRARRDPETIRRWIRAGRLKARKIGTQHIIEEGDLEALLDDEELPAPSHWGWDRLPDGRPMPNVVRAIRLSRVGR